MAWAMLVWMLAVVTSLAEAETMTNYKSGRNVDTYFQLMLNDPRAQHHLKNELTIFGPSDEAMSRYKGPKDSQFLLNHMANVALTMGEKNSFATAPSRIGSMLPGSPPLWLSKIGKEYYLNGAKLIMRNLQASAPSGARQRLHVLDEVLEPLVPRSVENSAAYVDLTAGKLVRDSQAYNLRQHSIKVFADRVVQTESIELFDKAGTHTFFIPVDAAFENLSSSLVDKDVVAGHVVLDNLLFTVPMDGKEIRTATYDSGGGSLRVTATIQQGDPNDPDERGKVYAKSNTVTGNRNFGREHVLAQVIKPNIPVSNGIVHLISNPLIIVAKPAWEYLSNEESSGGRLSTFARYIRLYGGDLRAKLEGAATATVFAPSNEAFGKLFESMGGQQAVEELLAGDEGLKVLGLHFLDQLIPAEDIRIQDPQNGIKMFGAKPPFPEGRGDTLWLYHPAGSSGDPASAASSSGAVVSSLMVDGLGVTAEVVEQDIGVTNGVIHVVDKVLGVPSGSVADKLAADPMMSSTNSLGHQEHFNRQFEDPEARFTYLVPTNQAWKDLDLKFGSVHKILFMGDFAYQTKTILERHLKIGESLSEDDLVRVSEAEGGVKMLRSYPDMTFVRVDGAEGPVTMVRWENLEAKIVRPNLKCTNGYIHVIDRVIVEQRDVTLSGSSPQTFATSTLLTTSVLLAAARRLQAAP